MRRIGRLSVPAIFLVCAFAAFLGGCASGDVGGNHNTSITAMENANDLSLSCATRATATAEAWVLGTDKPQVRGIINGGAITTLSNFVYPLGLPSEGQFGSDLLVELAWSPDAQHLAVAVVVNDGPTQLLFPYIVNTKSHAVSRVALPDKSGVFEHFRVGESTHVFAWADNYTLLVFDSLVSGNNGSSSNVSYSYNINTAHATPLPGVTAAQGVVRCSTLFYLEVTPLKAISASAFKGAGRLHRYNLATDREIGNPLTLGDTSTFNGAEGDISLMGWDVSPAGLHIAYQHTIVTASGSGVTISSKFFAANADGTNVHQILVGGFATSPAFMAISPDGRQVAVTNAQPTPSVLSGSTSGGRAYFYSPDAQGRPVWLADSARFEADQPIGTAAQGVERWSLNTTGGRKAGSIARPGASAPATLP